MAKSRKITAKHDRNGPSHQCRRAKPIVLLTTSTTALLLLRQRVLLLRPCQRPRSRAPGTHDVPRVAQQSVRLAQNVHAMRLPPCCRRRCASAQSAAAERRLMVTTTCCQKGKKCSFSMRASDTRLVPLSFFTQLFEISIVTSWIMVDYAVVIASERPPFWTPLAARAPP